VETSKYTFYLGDGGIMTELSPDQLKQPFRLPIDYFGSQFPISVYTDGKHLLADVVLRETANSEPAIVLKKNRLSGKPPGWDTNSNTRAFEVVDETNAPVFQIIYKDRSTIVINGIFCFGGKIAVAGPSGVWDLLKNWRTQRDMRVRK
jgi:hypothetical protein